MILSAMKTEPALSHFSCHGEVDYDSPLQSKLLTADWEVNPLNVNQIQLRYLEKPQLAYLSACFTAHGGVENQLDESVHLAGALQHAGFPNIIGSAWYVGEEALLAVVQRLYTLLGQSLSSGTPQIGLF
jgi:CHAT domain-containing protein